MHVEEIITDRIIRLLEAGTPPWHKPWSSRGVLPKNAISQQDYHGINVVMLACAGYKSPYWLTFKQAKEAKGSVKKGEHGSIVVFAKRSSREVETDLGEIEERTFTVLRYYTVFNVEQTEGCNLTLPEVPRLAEHERIERCEAVYANYPGKPELRHDSASRQFQAYYSRTDDYVNMPAIGAFENPEHYYSVLFHELTHSTGHAKRLDRETLKDALHFGDTNYSKEELTAEMGAAFLAGLTGIEQVTIENSVAYLNSWIRRLKGDPRLVISAAAQAQKAVDYILNRTPKIETPAE
jgi:antirestriction protein ArdC